MDSRDTSESRLTMAPFRLADWHVEPASQRISRGSETAKLEPKAMSVLVYLAQKPGEVVTRQELESAVWSGTVVGYDALSNTIIKLRKAFGDQARDPHIIETIAKTGYRLMANVSTVAAAPANTGSPTPEPVVPTANLGQPAKQQWLRYLVGMSVALLTVVGGILAWWQSWHAKLEPAYSLPDKPSIAVLPFNNLSDDAAQEYFVDGMTEDLITDLAQIDSLFVIARNTVFTYKGRSVVVPDVARELGVKYVLEGSVRRVADRVRINTQLINGVSGEHVWAERYDGSLTDIFALQDRVTSEIIAQLKIKLTPEEQVRREREGTDNTDAHDAYLRGWQLYRRYTPEDFVEAIPYLTRAIELDPDYGRAWAALASIYWISYQKSFAWSMIVNPNRNNFSSYLGARQKSERYLAQAMRNPTPLAHQVESQILWGYRQFDLAISEAERAIALDLNDPDGHLALAWALIFAGRAGEAIASAEKGMRLDPHYSAPHLAVRGMAQLMLQQYTAAEAALRRALALNPEDKNLLLPLTAAYGHLDKQQEARAALKQYTEFLIFYAPKIETYMTWWPFKREVDMRLFGGGLVKAGLCCEKALETYIEGVRLGGTLE